jgi:hypothetical protein
MIVYPEKGLTDEKFYCERLISLKKPEELEGLFYS